MGLKDVLAKMKLVELDPPAPASKPPSRGPAPPPARPAPSKPPGASARPAPAEETIEDILASLPRQPARVDPAHVPAPARSGASPAASPPPAAPGSPRQAPTSADAPDFAAIYRAARVPEPPHGFTCAKVLEMLASPSLSGLEPKARAQALLAFLEMNPAGRVSIRDVIEDAVRRDQALDAWEQALQERLAAQEEETARKNAALQAEIDELLRRNQERMRANEEAVQAERERVIAWRYAKMQEEKRLFEAVAPFVEANPVSLGGVARSPEPPGN